MRLLTPSVLRALPSLVALVAVACGDGGYPPLAKESGDDQTVAQHEQLPAPAVVLVRDADGQPLAGVAVAFSAPADRPYLRPETVPSDATGHAAWQGYLNTAGPQVLLASIGESGEPLAFHFQVNAAGQPFDGVYEIEPPWSALPCRPRFRIAGSDVTLQDAAPNADCYLRSASFSPTSGQLSLLMWYSVRRDVSFTGQLTLDARGQAQGNLSVMWIWHVTPPGPPPTVVDTVNFERL